MFKRVVRVVGNPANNQIIVTKYRNVCCMPGGGQGVTKAPKPVPRSPPPEFHWVRTIQREHKVVTPICYQTFRGQARFRRCLEEDPERWDRRYQMKEFVVTPKDRMR